MKKLLSTLLIICIVAVSNVSDIMRAEAETNVSDFVEYSFEDGSAGTLREQNKTKIVGIDENGGYLNTNGLRLDTSSVETSIAGIQQWGIHAENNEEFSFSMKVKFAQKPLSKINWRLYNYEAPENQTMTYVMCTYKELGNGWYLAESTGTYPGKASKDLRLDIRLNESQILGSDMPVYIDDLIFIPKAADIKFADTVFEWNAGDKETLTFRPFNNGGVEELYEGIRVTSSAGHIGVLIENLNKGIELKEGDGYRIEITAKLESGKLLNNIQLPYGVNSPEIELIDEQNGIYKIKSQSFVFSEGNTEDDFLKQRFKFGFGDGTAVLLINKIKIENIGKTPVPKLLELNTYAYTVDSNNEYAYGIVYKSENDEDEKRAVIQQYRLDGTATEKYFDIASVDSRYKIAAECTTLYQTELFAENGTVLARVVRGPADGSDDKADEYYQGYAAVNFNESEPKALIKSLGRSGNASAMDYLNGFTFFARGGDISIRKPDGNPLGHRSVSVSDIYGLYVDWDKKNPGRIIIAPRCYNGTGAIGDNSNISIINFNLDSAGRPNLNDSTETVINLKTTLTDIGCFNPAQMFVRNDKLYIVSTSTTYACNDNYLIVFDLSGDVPVYEHRLTVSDFDSVSSSEHITGIAVLGDSLAVFTSDGRRILDNHAKGVNSFYIIGAKDYQWNSKENPKVSLNARAYSVGFNDKYIYASKAKQDVNANSNIGAILLPIENIMKRQAVTPKIEISDENSGCAVVTVPKINGADSYRYKLLISKDKENWAILDNGISSDDKIICTKGTVLDGKYLRVEIVYCDMVYSYGTAESERISFGDYIVSEITVKNSIGVKPQSVAEGRITATVKIKNNSGENKKASMYFGVYDAYTDKLTDAFVKTIDILDGESVLENTIEMENLSDYSPYTRYLKIFVWDNEALKPLVDPYKIPAAQIIGDSVWNIYVAPNTKAVKGVILINHHGMGLTLSEMTAFKSFCAERDLAIMSFFDEAGELKNFTDKQKGTEAILQKLDEFSVKTNHPELKYAPLATFGHSNASQFAAGFAQYNSDRVFAAIVYKSAKRSQFDYAEFAENNVPLFVITGENDDAYGYNDQIHGAEDLLSEGALIEYIQDPNAGHFWNEYKSNTIMFEFLDKAYQAKVTGESSFTEPVALNKINRETGYIGYGSYTEDSDGRYKFSPNGYMTYSEYLEKKSKDSSFKAHAWLFDEEYAQKWVEFNKNGIIETDYPYRD